MRIIALQTWSKMAQPLQPDLFSVYAAVVVTRTITCYEKKYEALIHRKQVALKKGVPSLHRNHIHVLKKRKLLMRLQSGKHHIHLKRKKVGDTLVSPGVNGFYTWASPWPELLSRRHRKFPFYPVDLFYASSGSSTSCRYLLEMCFQLPSREGDLPLGLHPAWFSQPVCVRFPSLPGAWRQGPPNGTGLLTPTSLLQHRQLVGQLSTWLPLGPWT